MYIVLESEIKINYDGELEYAQNEIIRAYGTLEEANEAMTDIANKTLARGYFNKIIYKSDTCIKLHNGGTAYKQYEIMQIAR